MLQSRRFFGVALVAATIALLTVTSADAITTDVLNDANDVTGPVDILTVTRGGDATNVTFAIDTDGGYPTGADEPWFASIGIDVTGDKHVDYVIVAFNEGPSVFGFVTSGPPRFVEVSAVVSGSTLTFTVPRSLIGGATTFDWEAQVEYSNTTTDAMTEDMAPDPLTLEDPVNPVRAAGADRIDTAIQSCFNFDGTAASIALARSDNFADALAGAPLAALGFGCMLLTPPSGLDPRVLAEIQRVLIPEGFVFLLGGESALSPAVKTSLDNAGIQNARVAGANRFETAIGIAQGLEAALGAPESILLATGQLFPDALSASAAAASFLPGFYSPILLTDGPTMPPVVADYLANHPSTPVFAIGGPAAAALPTATPLVGTNRYDTAVKVANQFFNDPADIGIASGLNFPDALAGGAAIGQLDGPLVLTDPNTLSGETAAYLNAHPNVNGILFGGPAAVSDGVRSAIDTILVDVVTLRARPGKTTGTSGWIQYPARR